MEQPKKQSFKKFDVGEVIREKSPKLAPWIPGFLMRYLRKIVHEDFINEIIRDYGHLQGWDFSAAMMRRFNLTITVKGKENLPPQGNYIFASNHPLGGLDGHVIMFLIGPKYGKYKFLVNDILMGLKNLNDVFIPVNKHGRQGAEFAQQIDEAYKSDIQICTFPAGLVSRRINGKIVDLDWHKNFITKSKQYQRDVIPIYMSGGNTDFFYRLSNIRKKLGLKANIEMLYLIDETCKHENKKITVTYGKPIPWQTFDNSKRPVEWAKWVKQIVYKLGGVDTIPF